jgi:hypothetical protein
MRLGKILAIDLGEGENRAAEGRHLQKHVDLARIPSARGGAGSSR